MKTINVIICTSIAAIGVYLTYKTIKKVNKVVNGVRELKKDVDTIITDHMTVCLKNINADLEKKINEKKNKIFPVS